MTLADAKKVLTDTGPRLTPPGQPGLKSGRGVGVGAASSVSLETVSLVPGQGLGVSDLPNSPMVTGLLTIRTVEI